MKSKSKWLSKILASTLSAFVALATISSAVFAEKYKGELHEALMNPHMPPEIISGMLDDHPDWLYQLDDRGLLPVHVAAMCSTPEKLQVLLDRGADINSDGSFGTPLKTALMTPVSGDDEAVNRVTTMIKWLIANGGTLGSFSNPFSLFLNEDYRRGQTPSDWLVPNFNVLCAEGYSIDTENKDGATAFMLGFSSGTIYDGPTPAEGDYMNSLSSDRGNPLGDHHGDAVHYFFNVIVKNNPDMHHKDKMGRTAFHYFAMRNIPFMRLEASPIFETLFGDLHIKLDEVPPLKLLVDSGLNINEQDNNGQTPLHIAAIEDNDCTVCWLLKLGADPNITDKDGKLPIDLAHSSNTRTALTNGEPYTPCCCTIM